VELCKPAALQSYSCIRQAIGSLLLASTGIARTSRHLHDLGHPLLHRHTRSRHFHRGCLPVYAGAVCLGFNGCRRTLHTPSRILCCHRGHDAIHRLASHFHPHDNCVQTTDASTTKAGRVRYSMSWSSVCHLSLFLLVVHPLTSRNSATAVGAWRLDRLIVLYFPTGISTDSTYGIGFVSSPVEVNVAIISACCPALKALLTRLAPRLLGSSAGHGTYGGKTSSSTWYGRGTYIRSHGEPGDSYELGQQVYRSNQQAHIASNNNDRARRLPARLQTAESLSLSDEDGVIAGVMGSMSIRKTTNVTIEREGRSASREKASSVDSLV
jgi:hypothetical protein